MNSKTNTILIIIAVIILIAIAAYVWFVGISSTKPMSKGETFIVTVDPQSNCYLVNGEQKKELTLKRNKIYKFMINTPGHPFILTTSPIGGKMDGSIIAGTPEDVGLAEEGDFDLVINKDTKSEFFYQSLRGENYGAKIIIK